MGYSLQAIVAVEGAFPPVLPSSLAIVKLGSYIQMIPLGTAIRARYGIPFLPLTDSGNVELPAALLTLLTELNVGGAVIYIEAEIFGGEGTQAHVWCAKDAAASPAVVAHDAINLALRLLGVPHSSSADEFDAVGLGTFRETDEWLRGI